MATDANGANTNHQAGAASCPNCGEWCSTTLVRWGKCFRCDPTRKGGFAYGRGPSLWARLWRWLTGGK